MRVRLRAWVSMVLVLVWGSIPLGMILLSDVAFFHTPCFSPSPLVSFSFFFVFHSSSSSFFILF